MAGHPSAVLGPGNEGVPAPIRASEVFSLVRGWVMTGGMGFIGSALARRLLEAGAAVVAYNPDARIPEIWWQSGEILWVSADRVGKSAYSRYPRVATIMGHLLKGRRISCSTSQPQTSHLGLGVVLPHGRSLRVVCAALQLHLLERMPRGQS